MKESVREDVLMKAEYALKLLQDQGVLSCIIDMNTGKFIFANYEWYRELGYNYEELKGTEYMDLVHPDDVSLTEKMSKQFASKEPVPNELIHSVRYRAKNGNYKTIVWLGETTLYDHANGIIVATAFPEHLLVKLCKGWKA